MTVLFTLVLPLIFLLVLGGFFGNKPNAAWQGQRVHLVRYREDGVIRRLRASAAPRWAIFGSQTIVASAIARLSDSL